MPSLLRLLLPFATTVWASHFFALSTDGAGAKSTSDPLEDRAAIRIGGRDYALRFFDSAAIGNVERSNKVCLSKDGTVWVIDPLDPNLVDHFPCPWRIVTLSADRSLAVVELPNKRDLLVGVADLRKGSLVAEFVDSPGEYAGTTTQWVFCKKRQHIYSLDGAAKGGWHYLDLGQKKCVQLKLPGFSPRTDGYCWNGALVNGGKEVVLFVSGLLQSDGKRRMQFPVDEIEKRAVAVPENDVLFPVLLAPVTQDVLPARLKGGKYGIFSTQTWKLVKELNWGKKDSTPLTMLFGPGGRHGYLIDVQEGLVVYEPKTGKAVKTFPEANPPRGLTFSSDGRHGMFCTENSEIVMFDTAKHDVVRRVTLKRPAVMAFLIEPAGNQKTGTCLVVPFPSPNP
jgi:hypothetical protein